MILLKSENPALSAEAEIDVLQSGCQELLEFNPQERGVELPFELYARSWRSSTLNGESVSCPAYWLLGAGDDVVTLGQESIATR